MTILGPQPAWAQLKGPVTRGDLTGVIGWLIVENEYPGPYSGDDWHNSFFGAVGAGWYWTDHLKTEVDFGAGTEARAYRVRPITIQGRPTYLATESTFEQRTLGISQQYQFFRNAWFHPYIGAGATITWETITDEIQPIVIYEGTSPPRVVEPARRDGPKTDVAVRPFVSTGFKAYMTQRGFFRSDLRVAFRGGVDEVLLLFGFGIDF